MEKLVHLPPWETGVSALWLKHTPWGAGGVCLLEGGRPCAYTDDSQVVWQVLCELLGEGRISLRCLGRLREWEMTYIMRVRQRNWGQSMRSLLCYLLKVEFFLFFVLRDSWTSVVSWGGVLWCFLKRTPMAWEEHLSHEGSGSGMKIWVWIPSPPYGFMLLVSGLPHPHSGDK